MRLPVDQQLPPNLYRAWLASEVDLADEFIKQAFIAGAKWQKKDSK